MQGLQARSAAVSVDVRPIGSDGYEVELRVFGKAPETLQAFRPLSRDIERFDSRTAGFIASARAKAYRDGYAYALSQVLDGLKLR